MSTRLGKWMEVGEPELTESGKTKIWSVYSINQYKDTIPEEDYDETDVVWLGDVKFTGRWRKYAFFPDSDMMFEQNCLRDLAQFCEDQTTLWREEKKK